jgi:hypothetical protein
VSKYELFHLHFSVMDFNGSFQLLTEAYDKVTFLGGGMGVTEPKFKWVSTKSRASNQIIESELQLWL